jgi:hypothetical protein
MLLFISENELLELEIKALSESHSERERSMYRRFAELKRASLKAVKPSIDACTAHVMQLSKSLGLADATSTMVHGTSENAASTYGVSADTVNGTQVERNQSQKKRYECESTFDDTNDMSPLEMISRNVDAETPTGMKRSLSCRRADSSSSKTPPKKSRSGVSPFVRSSPRCKLKHVH